MTVEEVMEKHQREYELEILVNGKRCTFTPEVLEALSKKIKDEGASSPEAAIAHLLRSLVLPARPDNEESAEGGERLINPGQKVKVLKTEEESAPFSGGIAAHRQRQVAKELGAPQEEKKPPQTAGAVWRAKLEAEGLIGFTGPRTEDFAERLRDATSRRDSEALDELLEEQG